MRRMILCTLVLALSTPVCAEELFIRADSNVDPLHTVCFVKFDKDSGNAEVVFGEVFPGIWEGMRFSNNYFDYSSHIFERSAGATMEIRETDIEYSSEESDYYGKERTIYSLKLDRTDLSIRYEERSTNYQRSDLDYREETDCATNAKMITGEEYNSAIEGMHKKFADKEAAAKAERESCTPNIGQAA